MAEYTVTAGERTYVVSVEGEGPRFRVTVDGEAATVSLERWLGSTHFRLFEDDRVTRLSVRRGGDEWLVGVAAEQYRLRVVPRLPVPRRTRGAASTGMREVAAPMPGLVVAVEVVPGEAVDEGKALVIVEAMKMQSEIRAPVAGRIAEVRVRPGQEVMGGAALVTIDSTDTQRDRANGRRGT